MTTARADAAEAARIVVESGAVYTRTAGDPFFFTSGWASPIFVDIKRLISLPAARDALVAMALRRIVVTWGTGSFEIIAGCELAGIPFATIIADRLGLPLVVVRKQGKGFGRLAQFEGTFEPGTRALLVDDLSTDGINKATFRAAMERSEANVVGTFVLMDYAIFAPGATITSITTLADVIAAAEAGRHLDARALAEVKSFAADPPRWSKRNGGIGAPPRTPAPPGAAT
jgi:orotate phosphoribosyltransferase